MRISNSVSSCVYLLSSMTTGMCYHAWLGRGALLLAPTVPDMLLILGLSFSLWFLSSPSALVRTLPANRWEPHSTPTWRNFFIEFLWNLSTFSLFVFGVFFTPGWVLSRYFFFLLLFLSQRRRLSSEQQICAGLSDSWRAESTFSATTHRSW